MEEKTTKEKNIKSDIIDWGICLVIAVVLYLIINYFLGTASGIKQTSMTPTFVEGEKILIQRNVIFKKELKYGDVVTFLAPDEQYIIDTMSNQEITTELIEGNDAIAKYTKRNLLGSFVYNFIGIGKKSYIKRVIGLPGDHIRVISDGTVTRNDEVLEEPYLKDGTTSQNGIYVNVIVPENTIFVMGDNRLGSMDSRALGCIPMDKLDGYVIGKIWPLNKIEFYK